MRRVILEALNALKPTLHANNAQLRRVKTKLLDPKFCVARDTKIYLCRNWIILFLAPVFARRAIITRRDNSVFPEIRYPYDITFIHEEFIS